MEKFTAIICLNAIWETIDLAVAALFKSAQITSKLLCLKAAKVPRAAVICAVRGSASEIYSPD